MRSYFCFTILIVFSLHAITEEKFTENNGTPPVWNRNGMKKVFGPPKGTLRLIAQAQSTAFPSGKYRELSIKESTICYGVIGVCSAISIVVYLYGT